MTFKLGLVCNFSGLGLAAGSNHIYLNLMTAIITDSYIIYFNIKNNCIIKFGVKSAWINNNKIAKINSRADKMVKNFFKSKKLKNKKSEILTYINIKAIEESIFLIVTIQEAFNYLKQTFIKALIL